MRKKVTAILLVLIFVLSAAFTAIPAAAAQVTEVGDTAAGSMTLNRTSLSMGLSEDYTLRVSGTDAPVSWRSSSNAVFVEANSDGSAKITAINVGETTVTATAGGEQISCKVSVLPMAEKLELNETSLLLGVGEEFDLDSAVPDGTEAYYRMYSSSDKSVATVAAGGGIVTAKAPGRATITCTLDNGVKARCSVVVRPMAQSLTLNYSKVTLNIGEQVDLDSSAPSGTAAYYRAYTIDNTAVADVAISGGIVTAKSAGTATVTCTLTQNGVKVYCEIEVLPDPTEDVTEAPTEDLIEASKASSGVIPVHLESLQVRELVMQAAAEYAERMEKAGLTPVYRLGEALVIRADGRLLWRVFDNLLSNICKYALPGTRVYIEAQEEGGIVRICFKNVSAQMLGIDAQELTERFVRGDSARTTQGSGLGLSIAQSLTALQGGRFTLSIDGDLFTAAVEFARALENA